MKKETNNYAFIDNTNLYKGIEQLGWRLDYIKFRKFLKEKHGVAKAYIFIGFVPGNERMYKRFQEAGYTLVFKPTIPTEDGGIKGNCDAEMVLQAMIDIQEYDKAVLVTGDGDFHCLVEHLRLENKLASVLSPNRKKCSKLIKRQADKIKLVFLEDLRPKIEFTAQK